MRRDDFPGGWLPRPPDPRDFSIPYLKALADGLAVAAPRSLTPLELALRKLKAQSNWRVPREVKQWATLVTEQLTFAPTPDPTPPTPDALVRWSTPQILDQGSTPHCVGFAAAGFLEDSPVEDTGVDNDLGHALYYECKVFDGEPGAENGSQLRSAAKALKARGRIGAYAFAANPAEVIEWVRTKGPVQIGSVWLDAMFDPDAGGYVRPAGAVAGGHSYMCVGHDPTARALIFQNSWGQGWGVGGIFRMTEVAFAELWAQDAEGLVTVELPL